MAKENYKSLTAVEQQQKIGELTKKLREYRFTQVMGKVENVMEKRQLRRDIARLKTFIHQNKMGKRS